MKILGICGSPKTKDSTSLFALNKALEKVNEGGLITQIIELSKYSFSGCLDCDGPCRSQINCAIEDDFTRTLLPLLKDDSVRGMIISSPVYFGSVTGQLKSFFDRSVVFRRNDFALQDRVGGAITVGKSRHGGQELAALDIIKNFLIQGMIVVPDASPTSHFGGLLWSGKSGGIREDRMGIETAENLGINMSKTVKKLFG